MFSFMVVHVWAGPRVVFAMSVQLQERYLKEAVVDLMLDWNDHEQMEE